MPVIEANEVNDNFRLNRSNWIERTARWHGFVLIACVYVGRVALYDMITGNEDMVMMMLTICIPRQLAFLPC